MRRAFVLVLAALLVALAPLTALAHRWGGEGDCDGWTLELDDLWQNLGTVDIEVDGVSYGLKTVIRIPDDSDNEARTFKVTWVKEGRKNLSISKTIERDLSGCAPPPTNPSTTSTTSPTSTTTSSTTSSTTTSVPDTTVPDTTVPDTTVPDTTVPDTTVPDTTVPDTTEPTMPTIVIGDPDPTTPPPDTLPYTGPASGLFGVGATGLLAGLGLLALSRKSDDA